MKRGYRDMKIYNTGIDIASTTVKPVILDEQSEGVFGESSSGPRRDFGSI